MRQLLIFLSCLFFSFCGYSQTSIPSIVPRSGPAVTVSDARLKPSLNLYIPIVNDTANGLNGGLDSLGALIQIRSTGDFYRRDTVITGGHQWTLMSGKFNVYPVNGLIGGGGDSIYLGGSLLRNTSINLGGFDFSLIGLPHKSSALSTDSVTIIDNNGKIWKLAVPSGGGSNQILAQSLSAFADTLTITPNGNSITIPGATHSLSGLISAASQARIDSITWVSGTGHGIPTVRAPYTKDSLIFPGISITASNYLNSVYTGNRDSISFNVTIDTINLFSKLAIRTTISQLRSLSIAPPSGQVFYITDTYQQGYYVYDATDNTTSDNTGTTIVDAGNRRYKRVFKGPVHTIWFTVIGDGTTDRTVGMQAAIDYCASPTNGTRHLVIDEGITGNIMIDSLTLKPGIVFDGDNSRVRFAPNNPARKYIFGIPVGPVDQGSLSNFQVICNAANIGQGVFNFTGIGQVSSPFNGGLWHMYVSNIQIMNCAGVAINLNATDGAGDVANQFLEFDHIRVYNTGDTTAMGVKVVGQLGQTVFNGCEFYGAGSTNLNTRAFDLTSLGTSNDQIQSYLKIDNNTVQAYHDVMRASNAQGITMNGGHMENDSLGIHLTNRSTINVIGVTWKNVGVGTNAYIIGDDLSHTVFVGNFVYSNVNRWYTSPSGTPGGIDNFGNHFQTNGTVTSTFNAQSISVSSNTLTLNYFKDIVVPTTTSTSNYVTTINSNAAPGEIISIRANDQTSNGGVVMLNGVGGNIDVNKFGVNRMVILRDKQAAILKYSTLLNTWVVIAVSNQDLYASAAPTSGLYFAGEVIHNSSPNHTNAQEWVITSTGICPSCGIDSVMMSGSYGSGSQGSIPFWRSTTKLGSTPIIYDTVASSIKFNSSIQVTGTSSFSDTVKMPNISLKLLDTTNYKIVVADPFGNVFKMRWPVPSSSGVTTVGPFSGSSHADGASISGSTITFSPADATNPGMISTGSQSIAGTKTFNSAPILTNSSTVGQVWKATGTAGQGGWGTDNSLYVVDGSLTSNRTLSGANFQLNEGTSGSPLSGFNIWSSGGQTITGGSYNNSLGSQFQLISSTINNPITGTGGTVADFATAALQTSSLTASNAMTYTNAATLSIGGAPSAGANVTITNPLALKVVSGKSQFNGTVQIADGTQQSGFVFTSDANGNGSWQAAASGSASSGSFTPTLTGTTNIATISLSSANYIKVGNIVYVRISAIITTTATNTSSRITYSLPFTTSVTTQSGIGWGGENTNSNGAGGYQSGASNINSSSTQGVFDFTSGTLNTSSVVTIQFIYTL